MSNDAQVVSRVPVTTVIGIAAAAALVPLNSTMIAVALPSISDDFDVSTGEVSILITLYLVVMLVGQPIAGRVADVIGSRRIVQFALVGLAVFSALAAVAGTFPLLVVARGLQAACAAALGPGAQSLLRSMSSPHEFGRVFGIFGSMMGAGAAAGPVVGGLLVQLFDWRAIFVVNIPIALAALTATRPRSPTTGSAPAVTASTTSPPPTGEPAEPDRIFNPVFNAGFSAQALTTQAQYALLLLTPIVLDARDWSAGSIGLVLSALTFGMIVMGPIGGRMGDRRGRRYPSAIGIAFATVAIGVLAIAGPSVTPLVLAIMLVAFGVGLGTATPNLMSAALGSVPEARTGAAAGVFTTSRYVGSITTSLLIGALVADDASGTRTVLMTSVACMALAVVVTRWLPTRDPT